MQCKRPITAKRSDNTPFQYRCGQCIFCRVTKNQEWAFRLLLEGQQNEDGLNVFISLTYDNETLPHTESGIPTTRRSDIKQFVRNFRQNTGWKCRYFGVTEYGIKEGRPHGHAVLFINQITDLPRWSPKGKNRERLDRGNIRWRQYGDLERQILRAWGCKGSIQVGPFNGHRAAYVAKYLSKQVTNSLNLHPEQEPEKFTMTPGLGRDGAPGLAERITQMGGTLLELKKPGILMDANTWAVDWADRPIGVRNPHTRDKKTYPVPRYIRERIIKHLGGDQRTDEERLSEQKFRDHLRRLEHFSKREAKAEKFERLARRKLREGGQL